MGPNSPGVARALQALTPNNVDGDELDVRLHPPAYPPAYPGAPRGVAAASALLHSSLLRPNRTALSLLHLVFSQFVQDNPFFVAKKGEAAAAGGAKAGGPKK